MCHLPEWCHALPSFHNSDGNGHDPPPDSAPWKAHVLCEHGQLTADASERVQIASDVRTQAVLMQVLAYIALTNAIYRQQPS